MQDVKWIKLVVTTRNGRSMKQIKSMPDGYKIALFWYEIMQLAGECNEEGFLYYAQDFPYTNEMLANEFGYDVAFIEYALSIFQKLQMVELVDDVYLLANWNKYQNVAGLEKIREQTRKRVAKHRQKLLTISNQKDNSSVTCNVTVTQSNATEEEEDKEEDIDIYILSKDNMSVQTDSSELTNDDYTNILNCWNQKSKLKSITAITNKRKNHLNARFKEHGKQAIFEVIKNCGLSSFLRGQNDKGWMATFDWAILPNNFIKILEGNYLDHPNNVVKKSSYSKNKKVATIPDWYDEYQRQLAEAEKNKKELAISQEEYERLVEEWKDK